ncbi:hypothetical protein L873DRAFT_408856 [Choiromyces venosus 120613-1]|uniref:Uncharacterized protein n=1 Tax=Choiromyces venosus 120613-1 TaxID=1336337 RepID=A0A3N4JVX6_9PEZI|nr:hypothetical protein L873DRAFT_408856 [Choiromyces venosus 120613-1]
MRSTRIMGGCLTYQSVRLPGDCNQPSPPAVVTTFTLTKFTPSPPQKPPYFPIPVPSSNYPHLLKAPSTPPSPSLSIFAKLPSPGPSHSITRSPQPQTDRKCQAPHLLPHTRLHSRISLKPKSLE